MEPRNQSHSLIRSSTCFPLWQGSGIFLWSPQEMRKPVSTLDLSTRSYLHLYLSHFDSIASTTNSSSTPPVSYPIRRLLQILNRLLAAGLWMVSISACQEINAVLIQSDNAGCYSASVWDAVRCVFADASPLMRSYILSVCKNRRRMDLTVENWLTARAITVGGSGVPTALFLEVDLWCTGPISFASAGTIADHEE
ncbi:hypothetical protein Tco_0302681 [Tanacetum coccineum]